MKDSSVVNPGNSTGIVELIREDRRVTFDDIDEGLGISHRSAAKIVVELGFGKVCARWVSRHLTDTDKQARFEACLELFECHSNLNLLPIQSW